jgi:hypothetical protein
MRAKGGQAVAQAVDAGELRLPSTGRPETPKVSQEEAMKAAGALPSAIQETAELLKNAIDALCGGRRR